MFEDRFMEALHLLSSLGACEIDIEASEDLTQELINRAAGEAKIQDRVFTGMSASGSAEKSRREDSSSTRSASAWLRLIPNNQPCVPDDLAWYPQEPAWQAMAREALEGRIQEFRINLAQSHDFAVNEKFKSKVEADLKLFSGRVSAEIQIESESIRRELQKTRTAIVARFPSTHQQSVNAMKAGARTEDRAHPQRLPAGEGSYLADLADVLGDGVMSDKERVILRRRQSRLGLSDEAVARLEALYAATLTLTPDESEYAEEVSDCLANGDISEDERRILDRRAKRLGIPKERAEAIENAVSCGALVPRRKE
jgi:hypothetical protein